MPVTALSEVEYHDVPSVLVVADSEQMAERAQQTVALAGCRIVDSLHPEKALDHLARHAAPEAVLVELEEDHGEILDSLLAQLETAAQEGWFGGVVSTPHSLIDVVAAQTRSDRIWQLCDASDAERVAALNIVSAPTKFRLNDVGENQKTRLQQISDDVARIARSLSSLADEELVRESPVQITASPAGAGISAPEIRAIIRARRLRDRYFNGGLFADPAWDMLLDLMAARLEKQQVAVSSLCIAAAVPSTTALRWIKTLTDHGLFVRMEDPNDGRRVYIHLSDETATRLENYLAAAFRLSPLPI